MAVQTHQSPVSSSDHKITRMIPPTNRPVLLTVGPSNPIPLPDRFPGSPDDSIHGVGSLLVKR